MIPYELDLTYTPFSDTTILRYIIELPTAGEKFCLNLLDDEDFTIPHVTYAIPNLTAGHKIPTKAKKNVWIVAIIISQSALYKLNIHQTPCGKSKVEISI